MALGALEQMSLWVPSFVFPALSQLFSFPQPQYCNLFFFLSSPRHPHKKPAG